MQAELCRVASFWAWKTARLLNISVAEIVLDKEKPFWKDYQIRMEPSSLFALPDGLEVASTSVTGHVLTISLVATATTAMCPLCVHAATHIRSYYTRQVADVPYAGRQVQLLLQVRKFRCDTTDCPRRVFAERLAPFIEPCARMTTRLSKTIEAIGLATCGELGARFAPRLGIVTSPTTILRRTMALPTCPPERPKT